MLPAPEFYIGRKGTIANGEFAGWQVEIMDDSAGETGGYFIFFTHESGGFDNWLEKKEHIPLYFAEEDWIIDWKENLI